MSNEFRQSDSKWIVPHSSHVDQTIKHVLYYATDTSDCRLILRQTAMQFSSNRTTYGSLTNAFIITQLIEWSLNRWTNDYLNDALNHPMLWSTYHVMRIINSSATFADHWIFWNQISRSKAQISQVFLLNSKSNDQSTDWCDR